MTPDKLILLSQQAQFDLACACGDTGRRRGPDDRWIYPAVMDGRTVYMLKVLMDNSCSGDCAYCAQRAGRDTARDRFSPQELAVLFDQLVRARKVEALFLSSGLGGSPVRSMDRMLAAVEIIRRRYHFRGFVHLKILPGAQKEQVLQAARLAQRISLNLEAPADHHLKSLSAGKDFRSQMELMGWIREAVEREDTLARAHTTQFVVGAAEEKDRELVELVGRLYREQKLARAYFSAFQPVPNTPLENRPPAPLMREHRLYQVDFLLRKYHFRVEEIPFDREGQLSLTEDPKTLWASAHPDFFPLEVNRASAEELLRVPGLGPVRVRRIIQARRQGVIWQSEQLRRLGVNLKISAPFLLLRGRPAGGQLRLF